MSSTSKTKTQQFFDSEGFDLDAAAVSTDHATADGDESSIVYEIGGGITPIHPETPPKKAKGDTTTTRPSPIDESERYKESGNNQFKLGNHLDAIDYYTEAIDACPYGEGMGINGMEMIQLRDEFEELNREKMMEQHRKDMEKRRSSSRGSNEDKKEDEDEEEEKEDTSVVEKFTPPRHVYGSKLAVYHANRAASLLHLGRHGEALDDCDIALLYNPTYIKAHLRRSTINERMENTEDALKDAQTAVQLDPTNKIARKNVSRLEKIENERLESLKEETMGKLKDLGNSILGNFGLSLDNFNAVQDPNSGGYSISFNQGK